MNIDSLNAELSRLEKEFKTAKYKAIKDYCLANNNVLIGDKVTNGDITIIVDKIEPSAFGNIQCVYHGRKLKKDLTPFKSGEMCSIFQSQARIIS